MANGVFSRRVLGDTFLRMADFRVTPDFIDVYESLRDDVIAAVDDTVVCLPTEHMTLWARRGRLVGPGGSAWIIEFGTPETALTLYWTISTTT